MTIGDTLASPPPGSTTVGDLYVDLGSKTIWLGVDPAVDPSGAVPVSDIMSIQPTIDAALASANAFTTAGLATKAALVHTHVHTDITDFDAAVNALISGGSSSGFASKMVVMYSGPLSDIGAGPLANWALCDGTNGTPNLKDKFVMGAGNLPTGQTNPNSALNMSTAGAHVHVIGGTAITIAQMPFHGHTATLGGSGSGSTSVNGNHTHLLLGTDGTSTSPFITMNGNNNSRNGNTQPAGDHNHSVSVSVTVSGSTDGNGGNQTHTHTESTAGDHIHVVTTSDLRNAIPYYTLAFIMKL